MIKQRILANVILLILPILYVGCNKDLKNKIKVLEKENTKLKKENEELVKKASGFKFLFETLNMDLIKKKYSDEGNMNIRGNINELLENINESGDMQLISISKRVHQLSEEFKEYISTLRKRINDESGGLNNQGNLINSKNINATNKIMITQGEGEKLERMIRKTNEEFQLILKTVTGKSEEIDLPLKIYSKLNLKGENWAEYMFKDMPVGAVQPLFTKLRNDARSTEVMVLKELKQVVTRN